MYKQGKSSSLGKTNSVNHAGGKRTPSTFSKVSASAGKNSGTRTSGDKNGCKPMKGC